VATGIGDGHEAVSSIAMVATGIGDGHEAVSSIAMVATGIRDGHEAVSTITTEATGIRDEHKAAAAPPAFELNKMDAARSNAGTTLRLFFSFCFFWKEEMAVVASDCLRTSKFVSFQHQRVHGSLHPLCRP